MSGVGKDGDGCRGRRRGVVCITDEDIEGVNPMGRFASPEDIARAILFLAEPERAGLSMGMRWWWMAAGLADGSWKSLRMRKR